MQFYYEILAGKGINRAGEGIARAGYGNKRQDYEKNEFLMPSHPLTNFEIQKHYQNGPRFNGVYSRLTNFKMQKHYQNGPRFNDVYSRDNLNEIRDKAYVINLHEYSDIGTHWIALYIENNHVTYFDSFGVVHIPKEIRTLISNKNIKTNIFRIQAYDSITIGYFCIRFIDSMLAGKTEFTNFFSPSNFKRNDDIILRYFMTNV